VMEIGDFLSGPFELEIVGLLSTVKGDLWWVYES
jgi:hypothetical protein